ncbi:hypothetical protein [Chryseobacterium gleum]|uniref:hypothetical protein n=1 Tax=Chryseobacterium gleum TaxID=250 RepID=UPI0031DFB759
MNEHQKDLLIQLFEKKSREPHSNHPFNILIHSVLNTVDLCVLVLDYIENNITEFRDSIYYNISKRAPSYSNNEKIYDDLKHLLESGISYYKSQRLRKVLEVLLTQLTDDYKTDFFNTFFFSDYSNDRKAAIKYAEFAQTDVTEQLLDEYLFSGKIACLELILKPENSHLLAKEAEGIWHTELYHSHKKRLIEICAAEDLEYFEFLKTTDYKYYLLLLIIRKEITSELLMEKLDELDRGEQHFALLNYSKWIDFSFVEEKVKQYL